MKNLKTIGIAALVFLCILATSCSPKKPAAAAAEASAATGAMASQASAIVVFLEGSATAIQGDSSRKLDIGQSVASGWRVSTGASSSCDLKIGSLGTLRIMPKSSIELSAIVLDRGSRALSVKLLSGSVAAKVAKLGGRDKFGIATNAVACGVRGTEFVVSLAEGGATRLAVKEGFVAVLPPALDPMTLGESAAADAVFAAILKAAPAIKLGEEVSLEAKDLEASSKAWSKALPKIESLIKKEGNKEDSSELLASSALQKALTPFLAAEAPLSSAPQAAGSDSAKDFGQLEGLSDPGFSFKNLEPEESFGDASFDGSWDRSKWLSEGPIDLISPRQAGGAMRFEQKAPAPGVPDGIVALVGNFSESIPLRDYRSFGAVLSMAKRPSLKYSNVGVNVRVHAESGVDYWITAILGDNEGKQASVACRVDTWGNSPKNEYLFNYQHPLALGQAYDLRVDLDPAAMTAAWFLDGSKIAETSLPSMEKNLDKAAQLLLSSYREPGAQATALLDKVYWTRGAE
jgi:hypothetical protein